MGIEIRTILGLGLGLKLGQELGLTMRRKREKLPGAESLKSQQQVTDREGGRDREREREDKEIRN